jgi:hypothetical protein
MTSDKIREIHRAQPFHPFVLHLADGRSLAVPHPELMAISPSGRIAYVYATGDQHDAGHHIDVLMIVDIEVRGNGRGRRRRAG